MHANLGVAGTEVNKSMGWIKVFRYWTKLMVWLEQAVGLAVVALAALAAVVQTVAQSAAPVQKASVQAEAAVVAGRWCCWRAPGREWQEWWE
jgi:hypothetical protein